MLSPLADYVAPSHAESLCFWGEEDQYEHVEIEYGQSVRLKTKGDSPFIGKAPPSLSRGESGKVVYTYMKSLTGISRPGKHIRQPTNNKETKVLHINKQDKQTTRRQEYYT